MPLQRKSVFPGFRMARFSFFCSLAPDFTPMINLEQHQRALEINGFTIIENVFSAAEIAQLYEEINAADRSRVTFRKSKDLFAVRQFLKEIPGTKPLLFNEKLRQIVQDLFGPDYFIVKSIYFDKPGSSNWFVAYHQDLTISVDRKSILPGFGPWTVKTNQFAVQPPLAILENVATVRIHLDATDAVNGALKVIPGSHRKGIYRPETIDWTQEQEVTCIVPKGGIMVMKPLLLHSSGRTTDARKRSVIHLEFSNFDLPETLHWSEKEIIFGPQPILETGRLLLREMTPADAALVHALNLDPEVVQYTGDVAFDSIANAAEFLDKYDHYARYGFGRWAVIRKSDQAFLGWCGLKYDQERDEHDIGYRFFKKYWGQGYATESAFACIALGFKKFGMQRIVGRVMEQNTASIRVLEKLGLTFHQRYDFDGNPGIVYEIFLPGNHG